MSLCIELFTDASVSPQRALAVGAFVTMPAALVSTYGEFTLREVWQRIADQIEYQAFATHRSTYAEITTAILGLKSIKKLSGAVTRVHLYSDCAGLAYLLGERKEKLLASNFRSKSGKKLQHAALYKELFAEAEPFMVTVFKVKGHCKAAERATPQEKIFSVLDRQARKSLRKLLADGLPADGIPAARSTLAP